jgi:hypothetical protein
MKNKGWETFRISNKSYRPQEKRVYSPPAGQGAAGIDRRKLDETILDLKAKEQLKEVWDD